jgi:hypothetical protein
MGYTNTATEMVATLLVDHWVLRREAFAVLSGDAERRSAFDYGNGVEGLEKWGRDLFLAPHFGGLSECQDWLVMFRAEIKMAGTALGAEGLDRVDWAQVGADVIANSN